MDRDYIARDTGVAFSNDCMSQHCCRPICCKVTRHVHCRRADSTRALQQYSKATSRCAKRG